MKQKKLFFCKDLFELADILAKYVHDSLGLNVENNTRTNIFYPIIFRVDDTPTKDEWDKMTDKEKTDAFDSATGGYGIVNIGELFDSDTTILACCYYGGKTIAITPELDEDTKDTNLHDYMYALAGEAAFCDHIHSILVQINFSVEPN